MNLANSIAGAIIDLGADILAIPDEVSNWADSLVFKGHHFKFNQHFFVSYLLSDEHQKDEVGCYQMPAFESITRGVRQIITGGVISALARPEHKEGTLGVMADAYPAGYAKELLFADVRDPDALFDKIIAIDDVGYVVINAWKGGGYTNVLVDRPLDQRVSQTSALTGGRHPISKFYWGINPGGVTVAAPRFRDRPQEGLRLDDVRHGINVRQLRRRDASKGGMAVTFDVIMGIDINPANCWLKG